MAMRGTKTIKFGEFMSGEYKHKQEAKNNRRKAVTKVAVNSVAVATAVKLAIPVAALVIPAAMLTKAIPTMAATTSATTTAPAVVEVSGHISEVVKAKIIHAFDPLVDLMVSLSLPIASVMITGGALLILIGMKDRGYNLIMSASLGYVLVQLSPMLISLLFGIGAAV